MRSTWILSRIHGHSGDRSGRSNALTGTLFRSTQETLGNVAAQTRAVDERAAKLVGVELPKTAEKAAAPAKKAAAPAKKAAKEGPGQEGSR